MKNVHHLYISLLAGFGVLFAPHLRELYGQSSPLSPAESPDSNAYSQQLTAPKFTTRREAMLQGWSDDRLSREQLQRLIETGDPESRSRARWILDQWEIGLIPGLPTELQQRLAEAKGRPGKAFQVLLEFGYLPQAVEVARRQLREGTPNADELRPVFATAITSQFPQILLRAVRENQTADAVELLDVCAETHWMVVTRALLVKRLGTLLSDENILPSSTSGWDADQRDEMAIIAFAVCGEFEQAIRRARQADRSDLLAATLLLDGRWETLASQQAKLAATRGDSAASPFGGLRSSAPQVVDHALWVLALAQTQANSEALRGTVESLKGSATPKEVQWRVLAASGFLDEAVATAKEIDPAAAADLLALAQRHTEAFDLLGIPPHNPRQALRDKLETIRQRVAEETASRQNRQQKGSLARPRVEQLVNELTTSIRLLSSVGQTSWVEPTLLALAEIRESNYTSREAVMTALRLGREMLVAKILPRIDDENRGNLEMIAGFFLTDRNPLFFAQLHQAVKTIENRATPENQWRMTVQLALGIKPDTWNEGGKLQQLYDLLLAGSKRESVGVPEIASHLIGQMFLALDQPALAADAFASAAKRGDLESRIRIALAELNSGDLEKSLRELEAIFAELNGSMPLNPANLAFRSPTNDLPSSCGILAAIGLAHQRRGDVDQAKPYLETLSLVPIDPTDGAREAYVEALENYGLIDTANDVAIHQIRFSLMTGDSSIYSMAYGLATRVADRDPAAAAQWARIALIGTIARMNLYPTGYLSVPARWNALEAIAAGRRSDTEGAQSALLKSLALYPMNIDLGEEVLPKLRESGLAAQADDTLDRILTQGEEYVSQFPLDANAHNNLAWVAAINDQHLERALVLSRQAVFLQPNSTSYRDTLAEVLFRLGQPSEAILLENQCIADSPDQWHLHEQLKRFQSESPQ